MFPKPPVLLTALLALGTAAARADRPPWKRVLTGADAKTAAALEKRVGELEAAARFADAVRPAEEVLALRRRVQGEDHWQTADARRALETFRRLARQPAAVRQEAASVPKLLQQADGLNDRRQHAAAEPLYRKALAAARRVLGEEHPGTADCCASLALNLDAQTRYDDAEPLFHRALSIRRKVLGERHPATARACNNLAAHLEARGKPADAASYYHKALDIFRSVLGEGHQYTAVCYNNLAVNLNTRGRYADAEPLYRKALAAFRKVLGEGHPHTGRCYHNLAVNLYAQGKYDAADPVYRKALAVWRKALGEEDPDTASCYGSLAVNLTEQGNYAAAEPLHEKALAIIQQVFGEDDLATARSYTNLAALLRHQGRDAAAEPLYRKALAIRRKRLGEGHPGTAESYTFLALNLSDQGKFAAAQPLFERALAVRRKTLGEKHPDTARSYHNLASHLDSRGRFAAAEPLHRQALVLFRDSLGEGHPHTASGYHNLAANLNAQGKYAAAEPFFRKALAIQRRTLGEGHRDTARTYHNLAANLVARGKDAEAAKLWRSSAAGFEVARLLSSTTGFGRADFAAGFSPLPSLAASLAGLGKADEAWGFAEAHLARGLLDDLAAGQARPLSAPERDEQERAAATLRELDGQILPLVTAREPTAADKKRLEELTGRRAAVLARLSARAARLAREEVYPLAAIRKQFPADAAVLFWVDVRRQPRPGGGGEHWACVLRSSGPPAWTRLPGGGPRGAWTADDDALPGRFRRALADPATTAAERDELARRLTEQRLAPVAPRLRARDGLPAVGRLVVLPAGVMAGVPLEALTDRYAVSYAPSGTVFARLREKHRPLRADSLLALGDPAFAGPAAAPPAPPGSGLLVNVVLPGGSASRAGLRPGDVLLRYGGAALKTSADLKPAGGTEPVAVRVWRAGRELDLKVRPGRLGVALDRRPAAVALRARHDLDELLARTRGPSPRRLPGTRREVAAIARLFPAAELLLGPAASEQRLDGLAHSGRLGRFRVLHLATHGHMDPSVASRSALLLATDGLPDPLARAGKKVYTGRLTVGAVLKDWKLDADLVTLSACETALGPEGGGEGHLGFAQALLQKGARALVLSLWQVDDTATALLMTRFYENLLGGRPGLRGPLGRAEALAEARRWLRGLPRAEAGKLAAALAGGELRSTVGPLRPAAGKQPPVGQAGDRPFAHPYYWAAFVLVGDPD
jgi:tetratricopeptide (TPR) repeat protein